MADLYTPRTESINIPQGDDATRLAELEAFRDSLDPDAEPDLYAEAERQAKDFAAEAAGRGIRVVLRSVGRKTWRDLVAKNPPRDDEDADRALGVNVETFAEDMVVACLASPVFGTESERDAFLDSLPPAWFETLEIAAWALNKGKGADPKALLGSRPIPT